jgi:hypothetical protein
LGGREQHTVGHGFFATLDAPTKRSDVRRHSSDRSTRSGSRYAPASRSARRGWPTASPGGIAVDAGRTGDGIATTTFTSGDAGVSALAIQSDDKIVVASSVVVNVDGDTSAIVVRAEPAYRVGGPVRTLVLDVDEGMLWVDIGTHE